MTAFVREVPDIFHFWETQTIQDIIENSYIERVNPQSGYEGRLGGDLKFVLEGNDTCIDLRKSYIYFKLKLIGGAKKETAVLTTKFSDHDNSKLSVVNSIVHSLFKSCDVRVNGQLVTLGDTDYGYINYFQILVNTTQEAQNTYFNVIGWKKDVAGHMDSLADTAQFKTAFKYRREHFFTHDEGVGEFIMKPHTGLCFHQKVIPAGVSVEFKFMRHNNPKFYMMGLASAESKVTDQTWDIEILEAKYEVQRYKTSTAFSRQFEMMLKEHNLLLTYNDAHIHTCTIPKSVANYTNDALFRGIPPTRIMIAFVATDNYNGALDRNPYSFHHFNIQSLRLLKNGLDYPTPPIETNFLTVPNSFIQAYNRVLMSIGADYNDHVLGLQPNEYAKGFFFYSFVLAPDQESDSESTAMTLRPAQIKIEVRFAENLDTSVQMIVYSESPTTINIDSVRRVLVTHR
jgi:hypothetical protein